MKQKQFKDVIKELRLKNKMTQQELGEIVGLTATGISYWEAGKAIPNLEIISKLSSYFNVSTDYLMGKNEEPNQFDILLRKAERLNKEEQEKMYNIIENTLDLFLEAKSKNGK